jgi:predicted small secreted protein
VSDDELVFDEDFVRGAARQEASASERLEVSRRVARGHARLELVGGTSRPGKRRRRRRNGRRSGLVTVVIALVLAGALVAAHPAVLGQGKDIGTAGHVPPRPSDAEDHRILPAATGPAGTGGYLLMPELGSGSSMIRWSPCRPIHYVVRHDREPLGGPDLVTDAIREISKDTGLRFVNDGSTDEKPSGDRATVDKARYGDRWSPVLIAWATVAEAPELKGDVDGYAGPRAGDDGDGRHLVTGQVVLDEVQLTGRSGRARLAVYLTMLHELGHLVGLAHVQDRTQLMYPVLGARSLGKGDLRGLAFAGRGSCL